MLLRLLTVALAALLTAPAATSALWLPQAISSNMVLQRAPQQARLWGSAAPSSTVTVTLDSTAYKVYAQADGSWTVDFPPQPASTARTITIAGDSTAVTLSNVAFGDVYICSGQSNMEFAVADSFDAKTAIPDSANYPHLRLFTIAEVASLTPVNDTINRWQAQTNGTRWAVSGPAYVAGPSFDYFSATCYYFGRAVYRAVNPAGGDAAAVVPIGLIDTCWGGTRIEAWTTPAGLAQCGPVQGVDEYLATTPDSPAYRAHTRGSQQQQQQQQQRLDGDSPHSLAMRRAAGKALLGKRSAAAAELEAAAAPSPQTPSVLFNGMIAPIAQMRVRGATWYQGEANVGNATNYACRFPAMIEDWRTIYPNLAFYFVLLAAYKEGGYPDWPLIRDAQLAALRLPYVGVGSAQDLGDEASPQGAIHPRNKTWVGERLAVNALADIYHQNIVKVGPSPYDIVWPVAGQPTQSVILRFDSSRPENRGLGLLDTSQCDVCCRGLNGSAITVYTSGGARLRASVVVAAPDTVVATVSGLGGNDSVVSVQHNWEEYPQCALYNAARIPALPFNTRKP